MAKRNGSLTLTESVFSKLCADILLGQLTPGSPLMPIELKTRFNVSIAVIREALTRLAAQGLAKQSPNHGFTVITISAKELKNIIEARKINEGAALKLAISKGDVVWKSKIIALEYQLAQTTEYLTDDKKQMNPDWASIHYQFHRALIEGCNNPVLLDICTRLWNISEFYRYWSIQYNYNRPIISEHKTLMQAILDNNIEQAVVLYDAHIQLTIDILLEHNELIDK